jgi:hypothetical protein
VSTRAPWTEPQVDALNRWQRCGWVHPFTCGSGHRGDDPHGQYAFEHGEDFGQLVATPDGWRCPVCDYRQDWCHDFMLGGPPPDPLAILRQEPK